MKYEIVKLIDRPELKDCMAEWFHDKWGIPLSAYLESMNQCLKNEGPVPQWYVAIRNKKIIGGLGVIENDFHERKDLAPNVCAVYVEEQERGKGIAGALLNFVCDDMKSNGVTPIYLVTNHTSFYERYGWELFCMVMSDGETKKSRMYIHR